MSEDLSASTSSLPSSPRGGAAPLFSTSVLEAARAGLRRSTGGQTIRPVPPETKPRRSVSMPPQKSGRIFPNATGELTGPSQARQLDRNDAPRAISSFSKATINAPREKSGAETLRPADRPARRKRICRLRAGITRCGPTKRHNCPLRRIPSLGGRLRLPGKPRHSRDDQVQALSFEDDSAMQML